MYIIDTQIEKELFDAGKVGDLSELSRLITYHRLRDKEVMKANEIFQDGKTWKPSKNYHDKALLQSIMKRAWEIAYLSVAKFGGKVKEFFSESLRIAWLEVKYS